MSIGVGKYPGDVLLTQDIKGTDPLIEGLLWERDNTILVGKEKAGKSIFAMQVACALTCQEPFLGEYEVPKAIDVAYVQAEGKLADTQSNLRNMTKVIPLNPTKFCLFYYPAVSIDLDEGYNLLVSQINSWRQPGVIILDPLYMMMSGGLTEDQDCRNMVRNLRRLAEFYSATLLILHHAHRPKRTDSGAVMEEGDDSIFGSFVWKAFVDQVYLIKRDSNKTRTLSCDTQRMAKAVEKLTLTLVEPQPLYFEIKEDGPGNMTSQIEKVSALIGNDPIELGYLCGKTGYSKRHLWRILNKMVHDKGLKVTRNPGIETTWNWAKVS